MTSKKNTIDFKQVTKAFSLNTFRIYGLQNCSLITWNRNRVIKIPTRVLNIVAALQSCPSSNSTTFVFFRASSSEIRDVGKIEINYNQVVGGFDGVYEFSKDFRNEGMSRFHNPEFTQMELYVAYKDYAWMMDLVEEMVEKIAMDLHGTTEVQVGKNVINFQRPWKRYTMYEAIEHFTGIDISEMEEVIMAETAKKLGVDVDKSMGRGKLIDEIFGEKCEGQLIQPTFITDYPVEMSPLAKKSRLDERIVERFEGFMGGMEICNSFTELNDPVDQRQRFEYQESMRTSSGSKNEDTYDRLDEDFLVAIEHGMPPTAGLGMGIDRLTMILLNEPSIREVILFPQLRSNE